jgi:rhodanese-related sulfurtransferase
MGNHFSGKGLFIGGMVHLWPKEALAEARVGALLVDIRESYDTDYKKFDVPEVLYVPFRQMGPRWGEIPRDRAVIVADSIGQRGKEIVQFLMSNGYQNIANLNGGMMDWERDGMPMIVDKSAGLHGQCVCRLRRRG